ncbi:protein kinase [Myxococcota bacterium]|nr:protein kinase [Myxococcota bacterium]
MSAPKTHLGNNHQLRKGDLIEGKYRVSGLLAEGGMGRIYEAIQEPLGREVAVKILRPLSQKPEEQAAGLKRFFREASLLSRLNHPNTLTIFDYGQLTDSEGFFLVMELLKGQSLREVLTEKGRLEVEVALHIATQIAASLADAHEAGVIHRDLKPPNVMLVRRGQDPYFVKLVDFGLVKELDRDDDELTAANTVVGSPRYMAPERFLTQKCDTPALDIYALGIVFYEMISGRTPFIRDKDSTVHGLMIQHVQKIPPPISEIAPDIKVPSSINRMIMKCLAKDPEDRFDSMSNLLLELKSMDSNQSLLSQLASERIQESSNHEFRVVDFMREPGDSTSQRRFNPKSLPNYNVDIPKEIKTSKNIKKIIPLFFVFALVLGSIWFFIQNNNDDYEQKLIIRSEPMGAFVFNDGVFLGETPFEINKKTPLVLNFKKDEYKSYQYKVNQSENREVLVYATLEIDKIIDASVVDGASTPDAANKLLDNKLISNKKPTSKIIKKKIPIKTKKTEKNNDFEIKTAR